MIRVLAAILLLCLSVTAGSAQEDEEIFRIGDDYYYAGRSVAHDVEGASDLFMAGERISVSAPIAGSAHLAGRRIDATGDVGGDVYAAGMDVALRGPISGNATLAGYDVRSAADIGGNLRAFGATVHVLAPVAGTALLAGQTVEIATTIGGDVVLAGEELQFGPDARIEGSLTVYADADADAPLDIPDSVIPPERVEFRPVEEWQRAGFEDSAVSWFAIVGSFLVGIVILAAIVTVVALLASRSVERLRALTAESPLRTLWMGFLALSTLVGAAIVLAMTLVGVFLSPIAILIAVILGLIGYLLGVYFLGVGLWTTAGQLVPDTFAETALVALIGAAVASLILLVPFLGWIFAVALSLIGLGAMTVATLRPEFRS
jgi:hypothetical protein